MSKLAYGTAWTICVGAIAALAMEPALAEPLTPLPEGDPVSIDATSAAALLVEPNVAAELPSRENTPNSDIAATATDPSTGAAAVAPYAEIVSVVEVPQVLPLTNTDAEPAISQTQPVAITDVQVAETAEGFSLQLEADGELAAPETSIVGSAAIADIPNAVLQLPDSEEFLVSDPAEGISLINITNLPDNQVRIAITGTDAPPAINLSIAPTGLTISGVPGDPTVQTPDEEAIQVVVTGATEDDDYFVPNASTATRTDTPLRDVPQSIQVIPRQVIEDQQAIGIEEVLENAAGVSFRGNDGGRGIELNIRGFEAPILRDGFSVTARGGDFAEPEVANLERIEVLRGPASVLFGQADPGGVINLVTKQPLSEPYYNVQLQGGSHGFVSPSLDFSGPLTEDGRLLYRLNALVRREDGFRDFDNSFNRSFIAPTLTWLISDNTDLTVNLEYTEDDEPNDQGNIAFGEGVADIPPERVLNNPEDTLEQDYLNMGYTLEHRFSDNWQLRNQFSYISTSFDYSAYAVPIGTLIDESTGILPRTFTDQEEDFNNYSLYTNIQGRFNTGAIQHTLLFGVDVARSESEFFSRFGGFNDPAFLSPINIFDPDYSAFPTPPAESIPVTIDNNVETDRLGIYLQDQIDILDNLILVAGVRYNTVDQNTVNNLTDTDTNQYDDAFTPRIGIVYQPIEPISLYANYSRSFVPNTATDADDQPLPPEEGEGFEVGIRGEIIENRLAATLAYFDITKQNVATADPNVLFASVATGEQRSRGVDFSLTGEILPGWNVVASYAYIDAEVTEDNNADIVGNRLFAVPEHSASLWTTYEIQSGDLQGLGFGLGFNFVGEREGDLANSFRADSYFLTDAAVFYRRSDWQVQLNVDNLFDIDYVEGLGGVRFFQNVWGAPLTVRASVEYEF